MRTILFSLAFLAFSPASALSADSYRLLTFSGQVVKWGPAELGAGAALTYAFIDEDMEFDDARNCRRMTPVDSIRLTDQEGRAAIETAAEEAFAMWAAAANVTFRKTDDPASADILIGADAAPRGWAYADVLPVAGDGPIVGIARGLICLNPSQVWKHGFGGDDRSQDLRYTFAHEIGHAIGLNHPGPRGQLMSFTYREDFAELQAGDIAGARALYGPAAAHENLIVQRGEPVAAP